MLTKRKQYNSLASSEVGFEKKNLNVMVISNQFKPCTTP